MSNVPAPLSTKRNTLWNAAGCIFYLGCQWLTTVLVVVLSTDYNNSGALAFAMSVGNMFASVSLYKMRTYQVSDISCEHSAKDYIGFRFVSILFSLIMSCIYVAAISDNASFLVATFVFLVLKSMRPLSTCSTESTKRGSAWTTLANPSSCAERYPSSVSSPHLQRSTRCPPRSSVWRFAACS